MDAYSFGYPKECAKCSLFSESDPRLRVAPHFRAGGQPKLMLIGQDPTIFQDPERVKQVLMLDDENSQLSRWLRDVFGADNFRSLTLYATNLVKCSFDKPPSTTKHGGFMFLQPYFHNCRGYLLDEISRFQPTLVLTLGEPTHRLFRTMLDGHVEIADEMKEAFTGKFVRVSLETIEFDYSPCLHIKTFRVAEVYGNRVTRFKKGLAAYFQETMTSI